MSDQDNTSSEGKSAGEASAASDTSSSAEEKNKHKQKMPKGAPIGHVQADVHTPYRPIFLTDLEE